MAANLKFSSSNLLFMASLTSETFSADADLPLLLLILYYVRPAITVSARLRAI